MTGSDLEAAVRAGHDAEFNTVLYYGDHCVNAHPEAFSGLGKRCLIMTGASSAEKSGALSDVTAALASAGVFWMLFQGVGQNPELVSCIAAGRSAAASGADFIIGIGGGSPMDAAKAAAVFAANPSLSEADFYQKNWANDPLPVITVGTTAGTGSEVTMVSVLTDSASRKHSIHDPKLYPRFAFGDPRYTYSLPLSFTLSTGIDVLAHLTESYFSKKASDSSRQLTFSGIRTLLPALIRAENGDELSPSDREALYIASVIGGLAIRTTGTVFPHNVGYYLTENFHVPHGTACAVFLPALLEYEKEALPELSDAFYKGTETDIDTLKKVISGAVPELDIRLTESDVERILPRWENNNSVKNTAGSMTADMIGSILTALFVK